MKSPYSDLPSRAYWRSGVSERAPLDPGDVYAPRFPISPDMRIMTAGSCFAQHVGRVLREAGLKVIDTETLPEGITEETARRFGYRLYSARYGNIYTARQLAQLQDEANGKFAPALPVWHMGDRFVDSQRPSVEPDGLESEALVEEHRARHLSAVRRAVRQADLFVFTFGLTEAWVHRESRTVYPTAPGTIAGNYEPKVFEFCNYSVMEVLEDFEYFRQELKMTNPNVKFLVTVSPVPLTATASGNHVEIATCYSKSVLRAVCGLLTERHDDIDYFPSFEVITSQNARGVYYDANMRNVSGEGVATAMGLFMRAHRIGEYAASGVADERPRGKTGKGRGKMRGMKKRLRVGDANVECEEVLLEAFAK